MLSFSGGTRSNLYNDVLQAQNYFKTCPIEEKESSFLNLLTTYEMYLYNEKDVNQLKSNIPQTYTLILQNVNMAISQIAVLVQTLRTLARAMVLINIKPDPIAIGAIMIESMKNAENQSFRLIADSFFDTAFNDRERISDFVTSGAHSKSLQWLFLHVTDPSVADWSIKYLIKTVPKEFFTMDPTPIFTTFSHSNNFEPPLDSIYLSTLIHIYSLTARNLKQASKFLYESSCFDKFTELFSRIPAKSWGPFIAELLEIKDPIYPSAYLIEWLQTLCTNHPESTSLIFSLLYPHMTATTQEILHINSIFQVRHWFSFFRQDFDTMISFLIILNSKTPDLVPECLIDLFTSLSDDPPNNVDVYTKLLVIIESQMERKNIDYSFLFENHFFTVFIVTIPSDVLCLVIMKDRKFIEIMKSVFILPEAAADREFVFRALLQSTISFAGSSSFFIIVTEFLNASPTINSMGALLESVKISKDPLVCNVLLSEFRKTEDIAVSFVKANGLSWLEQVRQDEIISLDLFANILASLCVLISFDEVETFIQNLPKEHPLFQLPQNQIEEIVYGLNRSVYRPIRVYSLWHLLTPPTWIDPFNAYLLGKYVVPQYLKAGANVYEIPLIDHISNRFCHTWNVDNLIERPYELDKFADMTHDHFPLFQFYQGNEPLIVNLEEQKYFFMGMSFWFKTTSTNDNPSVFYRSDYITISLQKNNITVTIDGHPTTFTVDTKRWTHVLISQSQSSFRATELIVHVNKFKAKKTMNNDCYFKKASFTAVGQDLLFLGPAIRFYKTNTPSAEEIRSKGPDFIGQMSKYERVVTPYALDESNRFISRPRNCVAVPYYGFPFHFISLRRLHQLFDLLEQAPDSTKYQSLFLALLNINRVTARNSNHFWPCLLSSIKHCKKFVTKTLFLRALESVSAISVADHLLPTILFDAEMWEQVDNEILVPVLFEYFRDIDYNIIEDFELFLSTVVLNNPKSSTIIAVFLQNADKVPKLMKYLISLLGIAHSLDIDKINRNYFMARVETPVQHTILDSLISYADDTTFASIQKWLPFEKAKQLIAVSPYPLAAKVFHLAAISRSIVVDSTLPALIVPLAACKEVWEDCIQLKLVPLILALIWAAAIGFVEGKSPKLDEIKPYFEQALSLKLDFISALSILTDWFPAIVNRKTISKTQPHYMEGSNVDLSDISRSMWKGHDSIVVDEVNSPPLEPMSFMKQLVDQAMSAFDVQECNNDLHTVVLENPFFKFLIKLLMNSPSKYFKQLFHSFIETGPFFDEQTAVSYVPAILGLFLHEEITTNHPIPYLLSAFEFFAYKGCFGIDLLSLLLKKRVPWLKFSAQVENLLVVVFSKQKEYPDFVELIESHLDLIASIINAQKSYTLWNIIFCKIGIPGLTQQIGRLLKTSKPELFGLSSSIEPYSQYLTEKCVRELPANTLKSFLTEFGRLSHLVNNLQNKANNEQFRDANLFIQSRLRLDSTFSLVEERMHWTQFMISIHDQCNDVDHFNPIAYQLSSRSLPFMPPQVFTPSFFPPEMVVSLFKKNSKSLFNVPQHCSVSLLELFLRSTLVGGVRPDLILSCDLKRRGMVIPSVVFLHKEYMMLLTYAIVRDGTDIQLLEMPDGPNLTAFLKDVFLDHWGSTYIFASHLTIKIPHSSLIFLARVDHNDFIFWTFKNGQFILQFADALLRRVVQYLEILRSNLTSLLPPTLSLLSIDTPSSALASLSSYQLSCEEFILLFNEMQHFFFIDPAHYPRFNGTPTDLLFTPELLSTKYNQDDLFIGVNPFDSMIDRNQLSEKVPYNEMIERRSRLNEVEMINWGAKLAGQPAPKLPERQPFSQLEARCVCHLLDRRARRGKSIVFSNGGIIPIPPLTVKINQESTIEIDKTTLTIRLITPKHVYTVDLDECLAFASSICLAENKLFIVIDFEFGQSRAYRIMYRNGQEPKGLEKIGDFSWTGKPHTVVSGKHWICATARRKQVVLWEMFGGTVHRVLRFDDYVKAISMDEESGVIWLSSGATLFVYTVNGDLIAKTELENITSIATFNLKTTSIVSVLGFADGGIKVAEVRPEKSTCDMKTLPSQHKSAIMEIVVHPNHQDFATFDESGMAFMWSPVNVAATPVKMGLTKKCPICGMSAESSCLSCGRLVCSRCMHPNYGQCVLCSALRTLF